MRRLRKSGMMLVAACGVCLAAGRAHGQGSCTFTDENGKVVTLPNCGVPEKKAAAAAKPEAGKADAAAGKTDAAPSAVKQFPYPGEKTAEPSGKQNADAPAVKSAGKDFPYPGEEKRAAPAAGDAGPLKDAGSSGESSSSSQGGDAAGESSSSSSSSSSRSSGGDPSAGPLGDDPDAKPTPRKDRRKLPAVPRQSPDERELEDVKVAAFYQNDGNFKAAYERGKEAVSLVEDDAEAHLALAEAARKLRKLDEAQANYKRCLELDPVPKVRRAAEKALKEMAGGG